MCFAISNKSIVNEYRSIGGSFEMYNCISLKFSTTVVLHQTAQPNRADTLIQHRSLTDTPSTSVRPYYVFSLLSLRCACSTLLAPFESKNGALYLLNMYMYKLNVSKCPFYVCLCVNRWLECLCVGVCLCICVQALKNKER